MTLDAFIAALVKIRDERNAGAWPVYAETGSGCYDPVPVADLLVEPVHAVCLIPDCRSDGSGERRYTIHVFELRA